MIPRPTSKERTEMISGNFDLLPSWLMVGAQSFLDFAVLLSALPVSYLLRFDFGIPRHEIRHILVQIPLVAMLQFVALTLSGARIYIWRYTGMDHIKPFLYAALSSMTIVALMRLGLPEVAKAWRVPLSVNLFDTTLAFGGVFALRVLRRAAYEHRKRQDQIKELGKRQTRLAVLLIGAGQAGVLTAKEIEGRGDLNLEIKGFIDDDPRKQGRSVMRKHKVLGTVEDLPALVQTLSIDQVVITIAQATRQEIQRIARTCEEIPVKAKIIPGLYEILDGRVEISRIRDVQIEDLLGREPVELDVASINEELAGKVVMVTGAGGSIGSELARQVIRFAPKELLLVERAEFALFHIDRILRQSDVDCRVVPLVADVSDQARMRAIFQQYHPQVVIHAAAHKHVPLMEANPLEAIKNNVLATGLLGQLAGEFKAEAFVLISTDKAVRPTSIMGASKRVAELIIQDLNRRFSTRAVAVRFGNVIGSNGSAIPIFQEQIRNGGPLTITDKRMRRYFMTIPEAAQLVLQASAMGRGGEVFILHMGEPISILELAETLISLSGLRPHHDIKIIETGIRPGEKLTEELTFETEETVPTIHPKVFICRIASLESEALQFLLQKLTELVAEKKENELRQFLNGILPEAQLASSIAVHSVTDRIAMNAASAASVA
jgi:FlaA1/EpsC-like NDP-sugar epimerase